MAAEMGWPQGPVAGEDLAGCSGKTSQSANPSACGELATHESEKDREGELGSQENRVSSWCAY